MNAYLIRSFWFKVNFPIYTIAIPAEAVVSVMWMTSYSLEMQICSALSWRLCYCIDSKHCDNLYSPCIGRHEALFFLSGDTKIKQSGCWVIGQLRSSLSQGISLCTALEPADLRAVITPWTYSSTGFFCLGFWCCSSNRKFSSDTELLYFKKNIDPSDPIDSHICGNSNAVD